MQSQTFDVLPFHGGELYQGSQRSASFKLMPECVSICLTDRQTGKIDYHEARQTDEARDVCKTWVETGKVKAKV